MLSQILCVLPLLATAAAGPHIQNGPRSARHARHVEQLSTRSNASPVPIFNNALLQSRAQIVSDVARRGTGDAEFVREKRNKDGKRVRVMRRKVQACKAADGTTSQIGHELIGANGSAGATASASVTAAPAPSASGSDDGSEAAYSSAVASVSSAHSAAGYPTDWAGPSATSAGAGSSGSATASASASSAWSESAPSASATASPSYSSAEAPAPSSSSGSGSSSDSMLFPVGRGIAAWSTEDGMSRRSFHPRSSYHSVSTDRLAVEEALSPVAAGRLPASGNAPDGSAALVGNFPAGTVKLASGQGFSFYSEGSHDGVNTQSAKEVVLSYSAWFEDGFQFAKGGKMPGLYGGTSAETAKSCSGGKQDGREDCFSARLMWRTDGAGEIYNYYPSGAHTDAYCNIAPMSKCDAKFGDSSEWTRLWVFQFSEPLLTFIVGRGSFTWATGQWTTVSQRLKLNDVGQPNGEQELFVNGQSVLHITDLEIIADAATKIYGIMAQTFFVSYPYFRSLVFANNN